MSVVGSMMLLVGGVAGVVASWNAARPLVDPSRRYSPSWLPAMIIGELAPFWVLVHVMVMVVGIGLGGRAHIAGTVGIWLLAASMVLLSWVALRTLMAVVRLRRLAEGPVHGALGWARLIGRPVRTPSGVHERHDVVWEQGLTADVVRPDDGRRELPVVVYVHGGGWTGGDPQRQARDLYHALALDGWAVVAIRYPFTPAVSVEVQIETVQAAVGWCRGGLAEHGIEATHVALAGGSAGAHLAAMAAMTPRHSSEAVVACVGLYGIYDMANRNRVRPRWGMLRTDVMGERVTDAPARYDDVSPLVRVSDATPPMVIVHGTRDTLVPVAEAEQFVAALEDADRSVEYVPVPGAQHAFDAVSSPTSRAVAAVIRDRLRRIVPA